MSGLAQLPLPKLFVQSCCPLPQLFEPTKQLSPGALHVLPASAPHEHAEHSAGPAGPVKSDSGIAPLSHGIGGGGAPMPCSSATDVQPVGGSSVHVNPVVQSVSAQSIVPSKSLSSPSRQSSVVPDPLLELELVCPTEPPCPLLELAPPCPLLELDPLSPPPDDPELLEAPVVLGVDWNTPSVSTPQAVSIRPSRTGELPVMANEAKGRGVRDFI